MKKFISPALFVVIVLSFFLVPTLTQAIPYDWQIMQRNPDDTEFIPYDFPTMATNSYRIIGGQKGGANVASYYFNLNDFSVNPTSAPVAGLTGFHYLISRNSVPATDIGGLEDLLLTKANTSSVNSIQAVMSEISANLYGSSLSMTVGSASTSNAGLMTKTDKIKLDNMSSRSVAYPTNRSLNSAFQLSTSQDTMVRYYITISNLLNITGGAAGLVYLDIADNSSMTSSLKTVGPIGNSNTGSLVVGLSLNDAATFEISAVVPTNKWIKIRTVNTLNTPTFTLSTNTQEFSF